MVGAKLQGNREPLANPRLDPEQWAVPQGHKWVIPNCREKPLNVETRVPVPQTDTGRRHEKCKAIGRTFVKEFGKMHP